MQQAYASRFSCKQENPSYELISFKHDAGSDHSLHVNGFYTCRLSKVDSSTMFTMVLDFRGRIKTIH